MSITSINQIVASKISTPRAEGQGFLTSLVPRSGSTQAKTDDLAQYLVEKFNSPDYRPAFLRIAWRLEPSFIYRAAEQAHITTGVANPRAYFITSCKNEMKRRGVA